MSIKIKIWLYHWIALNKTIKTKSHFNIFRWYFFPCSPKKHFYWKLKAYRNKLWSNLVNVQNQKNCSILGFLLPPASLPKDTQSEPPLLIQLPLVELLDLQSCLAKFFTCTLLVKPHPTQSFLLKLQNVDGKKVDMLVCVF